MDVVKTARSIGLDLLTLPSHTSHAMQPLDVLCFKPFKQAFRLLWDVWTLRNYSRGASKEVLAKWISAVLYKALSEKNIKSEFRTIGIFPYNSQAMEGKMYPLEFYRHTAMPAAIAMDEGDTVDLSAKYLHRIEGTFMNQADIGGGPTESTGFESEPKGANVALVEPAEGADEDSSYESDVEADC